ncbi:MAG: transposase [Verrucomicrobia bacterium]|nr:transposase [Verrucomicrobiota bacterium]
MALPDRDRPGHHRPSWVSASDPIFVTLCGAERRVNQFAREVQWEVLVQAANHVYVAGLWQPLLMLAMPDHVHLIVRIPRASGIASAIRRFKRAASYGKQIRWQPAAFDHRIRSDDSYREKWQYVLANPRRGGLIKESDAWPYFKTWNINAP